MNKILRTLFIVVVAFYGASIKAAVKNSSVIGEMQSLVNEFFDAGQSGLNRTFDTLKENFGSIRTAEDAKSKTYRVEAAMPGYSKGSIKVRLERTVSGLVILNISADKKKEEYSEKKANGSYSSSEFFAKSSFETSVTLPAYIDINSAKSFYDNGILIINLKFDESKKDVVKVTVD